MGGLQFPSVKARQLFRLLEREPLSYRVSRQNGSHRILEAQDYPRLLLSFHDRDEVAPGLVRKILCKDVGLSEEQAMDLLGVKR